MKFSLIICTYQRPGALLNLLESVKLQRLYPDQILIIDGSENKDTEKLLEENELSGVEYYRVEEKDRGLTRQRNFGISKVAEGVEVVCFLDDDTILDPAYFQEIISTYKKFPAAQGVSGYIVNEADWRKVAADYHPSGKEFMYDGWVRTEGSRFRLRRKFGLAPDRPPGFMPDFSHGYSTGFLPPSGEIYEVEYFMGCSMSYKKSVLHDIKFSTHFVGYGLYEDMDFCLRVSRNGQLFVNTNALLAHYHHAAGRPDKFRYGKMVVRNGWYVWRMKNPRPSVKAKFKWHATSFLLTLVRLSNTITTREKKGSFTEGVGRMAGWTSLLLNKPKLKNGS